MAFVQRLINVSFSMGGGGSVNLSGLRVSCKLQNAGPPSQGNAEVTIYGMTLSQMNQLSPDRAPMGVLQPNYITITAGDAQSGMPLAFSGQICPSVGRRAISAGSLLSSLGLGGA